MVDITAPGESVLEVASGTGEISLNLAMLGRKVTLLDLSSESLKFSEACASELGLSIKTVQGDVLETLPFPKDSFDCSWSSGLLEHFSPEIRQAILREQARITRDRVISLVPNAACLAYRVGKADQEIRGVWPYGLETPLHSQRDDFSAAELLMVYENTVGAKHALSFLRKSHPLFNGLNRWISERSEEELQDCRQGYLLATVGKKRK
jgi:ubiquinone/menaquinone biosynthesis C-methylase UbiE